MSLTPTQLDTVRRLAAGQSVRDIAADRWVSQNTVKTLIYKARQRAGVATRADLIEWARTEGLLYGVSWDRIYPRCPVCRREQYGPTVLAFSRGEHPCHGCGHIIRDDARLEPEAS